MIGWINLCTAEGTLLPEQSQNLSEVHCFDFSSGFDTIQTTVCEAAELYA